MENKPVIIGIDHGYAAMKTAHTCFATGVVEYAYEPYSISNVLELNGTYYVVGTGRQPLQKDKTATENYYILTLAAIAKELKFLNKPTDAAVILAAGLPLTSYGRDKKSFREYLFRDGEPVSFTFEGVLYTITIQDVKLFPQGYAAVLTQKELLEEPSVILADLGGWTLDLMRIDNQIPNAETCRSLELGMIRCFDAISEQVRRRVGISLTATQIECAIRGNATNLNKQAKVVIRQEAEQYVAEVLSAIQETGLDYKAMSLIAMGGGAELLKRHVPPLLEPCQLFILDDISLNAKGFARLYAQVWERVPHG